MTILRAQVYSSSRSRVLLKLTADLVLVFDWIVGSCQVKPVVQKPVHSNPGLKVSQIYNCFFSPNAFFLQLLFCVGFVIIKLKIEVKQYTENPTAKFQNSNQNSTLSWVSLFEL